MRRSTALAIAASLGGVLGVIPAASGDAQPQTCGSSTSSTQTSTNTTTTTTTTPTTTTPTTNTTTTTSPVTLPPPHGHPLNNVTVENCIDGTAKARSRLQVAVASPVNADPGNFAYAFAHDCSAGCVAIAIAFQVALIPQSASTQAPENVALAVNDNCNHCGAFAFAYQYAVDVPRGTRLSPSTRHEIAAIRRQAALAVWTSSTFVELDNELKALARQLRSDVDAGLQHQHVSESHRHATEHLRQEGHRHSG
jgi:hypothetical protein